MLFNGAGFYIYYALELQKIKAEMHEALVKLSDDKLQLLKLTISEFNEALVEDEELQFDGSMYDVARISIHGDSVYVYCLRDEKEGDLLTFISDVVSSPLKNQRSLPKPIVQFLTLVFLLPGSEQDLKISGQNITKITSYIFVARLF